MRTEIQRFILGSNEDSGIKEIKNFLQLCPANQKYLIFAQCSLKRQVCIDLTIGKSIHFESKDIKNKFSI